MIPVSVSVRTPVFARAVALKLTPNALAAPLVRLAVSVIAVGAKDPFPLRVAPAVSSSNGVQEVLELLVNVAALATVTLLEELMLPVPETRSVPALT